MPVPRGAFPWIVLGFHRAPKGPLTPSWFRRFAICFGDAPPTLESGQRASALRFGDPRVMALLQAITGFTHLPQGFRNRDLRPRVEALRARRYTAAQMTYDLRRLRLKGLIHRIPDTHRYTARTYGLRSRSFTANSICASCGPSGTRSCPTATTCPDRCARRSINWPPKSTNFTRRPPLSPDKLASYAFSWVV